MAAGFSVKDALNKNSKAGIDESPRARFRTKENTESSQVKDGGRLSSTSYQRDIKILNLQPVN